jgi:hypothetical protein
VGKRIAIVGLLLLLSLGAAIYAVGRGALGRHEAPGEVTAAPRPAGVVAATEQAVRDATERVGATRPRQVLFGDLHVHTTFSFDAFLRSLPISQGEGAHPPADACDYARYCSALDFWSINDHAEGITPRHWRETVESIRQCNEAAGDPLNPDTVAFLGWEWTQVGTTPENHYGHKNVVLAHTDPERIPQRPIASASTYERMRRGIDVPVTTIGAFALVAGESRYHDLARFFAERAALDLCEQGVAVRELPEGCLETAATPADLFGKLDDWGHDAIVIPHGTTWGMYTPPGSDWEKQLTRQQHDPDRQTLLEVYSGHGDSDVYRDWRAVRFDAAGDPVCPEPSDGYLPTCWRAGEIIDERCRAAGGAPEECARRAAEARAHAAAARSQAHLTVPGARAEDWLDAGQCVDCDEPAFNYRPAGSAQYIMALRRFDDPAEPLRFRFGFMSSSDNHSARPGTGYKELHRRGFTESINRVGGAPGPLAAAFLPPEEEPQAESQPFDPEASRLRGFQLFEMERQASFFMTGGLVALHAEGRDRAAIWEALGRREVYGTSGPRILLWFDLLNPPGTGGATLPMGAAVEMSQGPIFQVRAVGSFEQQPGCPEYARQALGEERLERVCLGECYNPADRRRLITRIEVVRIRPQSHADEPVAPLIEDPWRSLPCDPDPAGCTVTFGDPDFAGVGRDALYYVRAIEEPAPGINAGGIRCERDAAGRCIEATVCGSPETADSDCLAEHEPRAWSSPIFVDYARGD